MSDPLSRPQAPQLAQIDLAQAHRHFSADCFNRAWELIDKPARTPADDEAMMLYAMASLWHWTQRADCTPKNLSIGHWQVSRACALAGLAEPAMHHARESLRHAGDLPPFYIGYAHEAIARAALLAGRRDEWRLHIEQASSCAAAVADAVERSALEEDLRSFS